MELFKDVVENIEYNFEITNLKANDLYTYLRRRYILITPCKRSAARGRKEYTSPSELRSSSK